MAVQCTLSGASSTLAAVDVGCSILWIERGTVWRSASGCQLGSLHTLGSFRTFTVCILSSLPRPHFPSSNGPSDPLVRGGTDVAASSCSSSSSAAEDVDSAASEEFKPSSGPPPPSQLGLGRRGQPLITRGVLS
ncbi:unnamed protein product [Arctogadus glacialis]